jgi:hypothetical protein
MSDIDRYRDPEERRAWQREYMKAWRAANPEKCRAYQKKSRDLGRAAEYCRRWRNKGRPEWRNDGFEVDDTNLLPETPQQSALWAKLLAGARL